MATVPTSGPYPRSQHATLTANAVDVVTLGPDIGWAYVEVINRDTVTPLWFTVDTGPNDEQQQAPTVAGPGTYYVGPGASRNVRDDQIGGVNRGGAAPLNVVRLIAAGTVAYTVTGLTAP